jgi:hypothetical protein
MSAVRVYRHPNEGLIVSLGGGLPAIYLVPGDWVQSKWHEPEGLGMLVANGDDFIVVLWSREPGTIWDQRLVNPSGIFVYAPYVPLQVTKLEPEDFSGTGRILTSYGKQLPNPGAYIKIEHGNT